MSKAFTKETDNDSDDADAVGVAALPPGVKNYITPLGYAHLRAELKELVEQERPKIVEVVHWAASNGDRSENGDYLYGKKRLREIDRGAQRAGCRRRLPGGTCRAWRAGDLQ